MASCDLSADGSRIDVRTEWSERDLIRQVPGSRWDARQKMWRVPLSWGSCLALRGVFKTRLDVGEALTLWAKNELTRRIEPATALRMLTQLDGLEPLDERLYPFQVVGYNFLYWSGSSLLADDMGAGKSAQILMLLKLLGDDALPALVISPNSVKRNWANECDIWQAGAVPYVIAGPAGKRRKIFDEAAEDPHALVIINIESVRIHSKLASYGSVRLLRCGECGGPIDVTTGEPQVKPSRCEVHPKELNEIPFRTVIVDEAHRLKDPKSKQTRACWAVGHQSSVTRRYATTGTPIADHVGDLWPIMHFLEPQEWPSRGAYIERYCLQGWNAFGALEILGLRPDTKDEFFRIFNARFRRMPKALVLPFLPPKVFVRRDVELLPKQRKAYSDLEDSYVTRLDDGTRIVTTNSLSSQVRLLQLASTMIEVNGDGEVRMCNPSPKLDELEQIATELEGKQFVVCAESRQLIELAAERLDKIGVSNVQITGTVAEGIRAANLAAFQNRNVRCLLFTVKAGGTGLNMTAADTIVRLQRSWSMLDNKQALDRVHRIGSEQHASILVIDIVATDTVEDDQLRRLYVKQSRLDEITRDRALLMQAGRDDLVSTLDAEEIALLGSDLLGREELGI